MIYTLCAARDNLRNRDGKRVFYLGQGDRLTEEARDFLHREGIEILPADQARPQRYRLLTGGYLEEKPEHMTHLHGDVLVEKTHPRIGFRGAMDTLEAQLLLCGVHVPQYREQLEEILTLTRQLLRCEVLETPAPAGTLCGMTQAQLRSHSHRPQDYYGQPHFMPTMDDSLEILWLNRIRCGVREAERAAALAFGCEEKFSGILTALNRMSSMVYLLMIQAKAKEKR